MIIRKKIKLCIYLTFAVIILDSAINKIYSQWALCQGGNSYYLDAIVSKDNYLLAAGDYFFLSADSGFTWFARASDSIKYVNCIEVNGNDIFVGAKSGFFGGIYLSTNDGVNWVRGGLNYAGSNYLNIYCINVNGNTIYAGTYLNGVYKSTNYGLNWFQTDLNDCSVNSIEIINNTILAGSSDSGIYISTNNGVNWNHTGFYKQVTRLEKNGEDIFAGTINYGLYISTDYGYNWTNRNLTNISAMSIALNGTNILIGSFGDGIYVSKNYGLNWVQRNEGFTIYPIFVTALHIYNNIAYAGMCYNHFIWRRPFDQLIGIKKISSNIPELFHLHQNYPNPFNSSTNIKFEISKRGMIELKIFDVNGKLLTQLFSQNLEEGIYNIPFYSVDFSSGVYFYTMFHNGNIVDTKKLLLLK